MKQRAIIPIVAASRAALKGLVDHSFEGVNYGNDSLNKFSELNLRSGALKVESYAPNGYSNPGFANLTVSKGSLSDGGVIVGNTAYKTGQQFSYEIHPSKPFVFPVAHAGDSAEAVLRPLAEWGATEFEVVAPGNQLTFLTVSLLKYVKVGDNRAPISEFKINRILFPSTESTPAQVDDVNGSWKVRDYVSEGTHEAWLTNGEAEVGIRWEKEKSKLSFLVSHPIRNYLIFCGGAVIRSAYVNGVWKRSNAKLEFSIPEEEDKYTYEQWRSYYESTGVSAKYLNQGDESTGIQG